MTLDHKQVAEATWTQIQSLREAIDPTEPNKKRRNTNRLETYLQCFFIKYLIFSSLFQAVTKRFQEGRACNKPDNRCHIGIKTSDHPVCDITRLDYVSNMFLMCL